jgi:hypothetical protein
VFPSLNEDTWKEILKKDDFTMDEMLYSLRLKNITGYMEPCHFCADKRCDGCPLPYTDDIIYNDFLTKIGVNSNSSFYTDSYQKRGRNELIIDIVFSR